MNAAESRLPRWFTRLVTLTAAGQLLHAALAVFAVPQGWRTVFGIPLVMFRAAAIMAALVVAGCAVIATLPQTRTTAVKIVGWAARFRQHRASVVLPLLLLVAGAALLPSGWIGHIVLGVQFILFAVMVYLTDPAAWGEKSPRWMAAAPFVIIAIGIGLRVWFMLTGAFGDEGFFLSGTMNMITSGGIAPISIQLPESIPHRPDWGRLLIIYGWWAKIAGFGLMNQRVLGLLLGLAVIATSYAACQHLFGRRAGLISAAFVAISYMGIQTVAARLTGLPMLAFSIALLAHLIAREKGRASLHVLAGLLSALSLEVHLINLSVVSALGGAYVVEYIAAARRERRWLRDDPLWWFAAGIVPGMAGYIYLHIFTLPDPAAYTRYLDMYATGGSLVQRLGLWASGIIPQFIEVWWFSPVELVLIAASAAAALWRRTSEDRHWLVMLVFYELGFLVFRPQGVINIGYSAAGLSLLLAGSGALITSGFSRDKQPSPVWAKTALPVLAVSITAFIVSAAMLSQQAHRSLDSTVSAIRDSVRDAAPEGSTMVGPVEYYPWFTDYDYLFPHNIPESAMAAVLLGTDNDAYWMKIYREKWPAVMITSHLFAPADSLNGSDLFSSYLLARHASHVSDFVWAVPAANVLRSLDQTGAALQVAAVSQPGTASPGEMISVDTVWVAQQAVAADARTHLLLTGGEETIPLTNPADITAGWNGQPTSQWEPYRFYDVALSFTIPSDITPGDYALVLDISPTTDCAPACTIKLTTLSIAP